MRVDPTEQPILPPSAVAAPPAPIAPTGRAYVQLVIVLGALIGLGPLTIDMYLPALPALQDDLGVTESATQLTLTGMLAGLAVGQLIIGPISDSVGRRRPLLIGISVHVLASVLCLLAPGIVTLTAARVIQGFAGAALGVSAMATVRDLFSGVAAARVLSRLMLVMGAAPVLAPTLGGLVLEWTNWRGIFAVLGAAGVVLVTVAFFGLKETLPVSRRRSLRLRSTLRTYGTLLRDVPFVALILVAGTMMSAMFAYVSGSSFVLQDVYGLSERAFAIVFGVNALGIIVFTQLNPVLLKRYAPQQILGVATVLAAASAAVLVTAAITEVGGLATILPPLAMIIASCGLALPNTPALALSRHGEAAGTAAAMLGCVQFGIGAVVAPLVGAFANGTAVPMAMVMLVVTSTAAVIVHTVVRRAYA
ncbi:multidrug effflux MFS transporter [Solicola gregarius]|uniref:Multidrug effflux MFS transporter n=1 Tax=Solicola gregarius TaxID=2908642 RepID=A0AA46TKB8_9ACTN|nr:multidrug effflux MFS transporter [Solicola gregarius]UYM06680.1 multidrug effflux MFS transporter [Solicola gregarius]